MTPDLIMAILQLQPLYWALFLLNSDFYVLLGILSPMTLHIPKLGSIVIDGKVTHYFIMYYDFYKPFQVYEFVWLQSEKERQR